MEKGVGKGYNLAYKEDRRVKRRGKRIRNPSRLQRLLMERNNAVNYISEGYLFQNEFLMKK